MDNHKRRIKMKGGDEFDALSKKSRKFLAWGKGEVKKIKQKYNKRFRKEGKNETKEKVEDV